MSDALHDLTEADVTAEYVRRRVDDWVARIGKLYAALQAWLPPDCTATRSGTVPMHEELMQRFSLQTRRLPVLEVKRGGSTCATVKPHGLWIIGANGRLDLRTARGTFIIIDRSLAFEPPLWHIAPLSDRTRYEPLTEATFGAVL